MLRAIVILTLALAAAAAAAPAPVPAQQRAPVDDRAALLQSLQRGKSFTVGRERYQQLPEVFAVERRGGDTPQQALEAAGAGAAQVIETKGRLVLYRGGVRADATNIRPTVINVRTGTLGVLSGTLVVKLKNFPDAGAIAGRHGLETARAFAHLRTVFYRAPAAADLADLVAALQADAAIESAYPEIIEYLRQAK